jgi:VCBS repeat-containing protein
MAEHTPRCPGCFTTRIPDRADSCPTCGFQPEQAARQRSSIALPLGAMIRERYQIGRVLGEPGGFGVTYLAFDERLHTRVAIKEYMPRDVAGRATSDGSEVWSSGGHEETFQHGLDQFLREARTLAKFDHPNVVGVSNYFETNGTGYLVMDYYEGTTVHQHLAAQPDGWMDLERASGIIQEVANGLREVHAEGYLHRDIKPSNIYLTQDGRPILIDFGAARVALGEHSQNLSVLVTPGYAPYEQYRVRGDQGPHTDVYSCAATLYRMVTGTVPEPASERIVDDKLKPPRALNPAVPPELSTVIEEAMAVQGENRPATAKALQRRLRAVTYEGREEPQQEGRRVAEEETSSSTTSSRKARTSASSEAPQWATTLLGVLVLATLGLGGWAEYRYDLVGLFPEGTASGNTSVIADAGGEADPDLPESVGGDGSSARSADGVPSNGESPVGPQDSSPPADEENQAQVPEENDPSSQGQKESEPPADIADPGLPTNEEASDGPSRNAGEDSASESSQTSGESSSDQADPARGDGAGSEGPERLEPMPASEVEEGGSLNELVPHKGEGFDPQEHSITKINDTDRVDSEMMLESGARLTVQSKGRFTYDPNGAFRALDARKDTTDQFTYTAVRESDGRKLRGTVKIPIEGKNTPPTLETNEELGLKAEQAMVITRRNLKATDPDDKPGEIRFRVREGPTRGQILVGDDPVVEDSSFMQQDIGEGRVFYEDTTGEAGTDTLTFALEDDNGEGPEEETFRVSIEPAPEAGTTESDTSKSDVTKTASSTKDNCRIQFAATPSEGPDDLSPEDSTTLADSEVADELRPAEVAGKDLRVGVKYVETEEGAVYGLFSERTGTRKEMNERKKELTDTVDSALVRCF